MRQHRPDPDELLRRWHKAETQAGHGKLRVFFGFAPGVGKTYRMLQVARELGLDVVVGIVETHGRRETQAMLEGLPVLARRRADYRGRTFTEFDLDAALARKPALLLVDELAHTNAPGSRHPKRWQDVLELLDAGIDVLTTVNVQHLESLNDVIAQITGIQVRETLPDSILERADAIELIDIAPEDLLQRLKEGKVYVPEQAAHALDHFFKRGNLLALRELALRRTAQHVDDDVLEYREEHGVEATWPAGERIMVCVGAAPSSGRLIRAAARMAVGLRCPWVAAYVEGAGFVQAAADRERLEAHLRVVESLGGAVVRLSGVGIADAILSYASRHNITRIVIGKPTHPRIRDRLRGSLLDEVVRGSGEIEVHVSSGDGFSRQAPKSARTSQAQAIPAHYVISSLIVAATLAVAALLRVLFQLPDPEMLFLLSIMVTAILFGRGPSLFAAALSVCCYDFFLVPPLYGFSVTDRRYLLTFATMFGVGLLLSELAGRIKRQERDAVSREERTSVLYTLSRELTVADNAGAIAAVAAQQAAQIFSADAAILLPDECGQLQLTAASPTHTTLEAKDLGVARWAFEHARLAGFGTDTLPASATLCAPLNVASPVGVLSLAPAHNRALGAEQRTFLEVFCRQIGLALERVRFASAARAATLRAKTEDMRSSLLSSVSHDLRTPLASITGAATSLRDDADLSRDTREELVESICDEAARLERLVANLLDMTRLESGALRLERDWIPLDECIGSALTRLDQRLGERAVRVDLEQGMPLVLVDPVLLEQLFLNLIDNAIKYTPPGSTIEIHAHRRGELVVITVSDHGPGLPPGDEDKVFNRFFRGQHASVSGAGLGLAICRGIAEAHAGSIHAHNRSAGGAVFELEIPVGGEPPSMPRGEALGS